VLEARILLGFDEGFRFGVDETIMAAWSGW
jgi:hypothetical protein